jgi:hypothetical protein
MRILWLYCMPMLCARLHKDGAKGEIRMKVPSAEMKASKRTATRFNRSDTSRAAAVVRRRVLAKD